MRLGQELVKVSALFCLLRSYTQSNKMKTFALFFVLTGVKYYLCAPTHLIGGKKSFKKIWRYQKIALSLQQLS